MNVFWAQQRLEYVSGSTTTSLWMINLKSSRLFMATKSLVSGPGDLIPPFAFVSLDLSYFSKLSYSFSVSQNTPRD
jgi:hypothetical protein